MTKHIKDFMVSIKSNLTESLLDRYLSSKGINPKYISKDSKISYSKSNEFKMWANNHRYEGFDPELNEAGNTHVVKSKTGISLADLRAKSNATKEIGTHSVKEDVEDLEEAKSDYTIYHPTYSSAVQHARAKLQDKGLEIHDDDWFREVNSGPRKPSPGDTNSLHIPLHKDGKETKKHAHIQVYNRGDDVKNAYELNMYHEEVEIEESRGHKTLATWFKKNMPKEIIVPTHSVPEKDRTTDTLAGRVVGGKENEHHSFKVKMAEDDEVTTDMIKGRVVGGKPNSFKSFKVKLRSASGAGASGVKVSEDVELEEETLDEAIDKEHQYKVHTRSIYRSPEWSHHEGDTYNSLDMAKRVVSNMKKGASSGTEHKITRVPRKKLAGPSGKLPESVELEEDTFQDAKAATQTVGMEVESKKKLIKSLLSKSHRVAEDMYDHEKEDKSVQTYGKKPKMEKAEKEDSGVGDKKPHAVGIMSGGTTLTGEKRDDVEIDPMMRNRPGQPEVGKKDDKKKDDKKKDDKKQESK